MSDTIRRQTSSYRKGPSARSHMVRDHVLWCMLLLPSAHHGTNAASSMMPMRGMRQIEATAAA